MIRREAVFSPVAGESSLARIVRSLAPVADVVVAAAAPLVDEVKKSLAQQGLSATRVCVADDPGARRDCISAALRVPASSVVQRGQMEILFVVRDGLAQLRIVKTGKRVGAEVELVSGLEAGETIVVSGGAGLVDGQPVTVR